jgi:uncharacterized Tic20 family protein
MFLMVCSATCVLDFEWECSQTRHKTITDHEGRRIMAENDPTAPEQAPSGGGMTQDEKNLCILVHILAIFTHFLGPLIIWLIKKDESREVGRHAIEVLNFCITIAIAFFACFLLAFVFIGVILLPLLCLYALINLILGAVAASKGEFRPYPLTLRLLK